MPALETTDLRQRAVLWQFVRQDRHGVPVVAQPVEIRVRWLVNESQVTDPTGNTVAKAGTMITDVDVPPMSILRLGRKRDLPVSPDDLHTAIRVSTTPDIKNRHVRYEYTLMRYSDRLPTVG